MIYNGIRDLAQVRSRNSCFSLRKSITFHFFIRQWIKLSEFNTLNIGKIRILTSSVLHIYKGWKFTVVSHTHSKFLENTSLFDGLGLRIHLYLIGLGLRIHLYLIGLGFRIHLYLIGLGFRIHLYLIGLGLRIYIFIWLV